MAEHPRAEADGRALSVALGLVLAFMGFEVAAAAVSGSLALLADAGHMLADAGAIGASLVAARLAARPASGSWTFGLKRAEILSAAGNGVTLVVVGGIIAYEAVLRLISPPPVEGAVLVVVAGVGVVVNVAITWILAGDSRRTRRSGAHRGDRSLNLEGAFRHVVTDLYAFVGTALAGVVILVSGWARADAVASLLVVGLMWWASAGLLRRSGRILLEAAPEGVEPGPIAGQILALPEVVEVHDLHLWVVTSGFPALSAHVLVDPAADCHQVRRQVEALVAKEGVAHTTLQVDHATPGLLNIGTSRHADDPRS